MKTLDLKPDKAIAAGAELASYEAARGGRRVLAVPAPGGDLIVDVAADGSGECALICRGWDESVAQELVDYYVEGRVGMAAVEG
jgi:hypothetical protein